GWGAWVLLAAAALPLVVLTAVTADVLGGSLDAVFFGTPVSPVDGDPSAQVLPGVTAVHRFSVLWSTVPVGRALLASVLTCTALAVLRLAGRPAWAVPGPAARWAAAAVAWAGAAAALGSLLALLAAGRDDTGLVPFSTGSTVLDVAARGGEVVVPVLLGAVTGAVLLWPGAPAAPAPQGEPGPQEEPAPQEALPPGTPPEPQPAPGPAQGPAPEPQPAPDRAPEPPPPPGRAGAAAGAGYPRPSDEEYALYRRPPR
ncbi:hypothetical protein GTR00_16430, partial [Kineococcus sp. T90]|nr:hypothetical protein [Kineococcus indalonis]